eukprot:7238663-Prymnesium_polylepis.2
MGGGRRSASEQTREKKEQPRTWSAGRTRRVDPSPPARASPRSTVTASVARGSVKPDKRAPMPVAGAFTLIAPTSAPAQQSNTTCRIEP